jgi:hypothetical protein
VTLPSIRAVPILEPLRAYFSFDPVEFGVGVRVREALQMRGIVGPAMQGADVGQRENNQAMRRRQRHGTVVSLGGGDVVAEDQRVGQCE